MKIKCITLSFLTRVIVDRPWLGWLYCPIILNSVICVCSRLEQFSQWLMAWLLLQGSCYTQMAFSRGVNSLGISPDYGAFSLHWLLGEWGFLHGEIFQAPDKETPHLADDLTVTTHWWKSCLAPLIYSDKFLETRIMLKQPGTLKGREEQNLQLWVDIDSGR